MNNKIIKKIYMKLCNTIKKYIFYLKIIILIILHDY